MNQPSGKGAAKPGEDAKAPKSAPAQVGAGIPIILGQPLVLRRRKKKKKRKYTRGTKDLQRVTEGASRASWRLGKAASDGFRIFYRRSRRSSRKRRDGAYRDLLKNSSKAIDKTFRVAGRAPYDVVKKLNTRDLWRASRPAITYLSTPWLGFFR